ncbi:hypothetical protein B9Z45_04005 [Limnohabitans sp. 2KL-17]|uniref:DUF3047 domain-containing protein n=1 Tax=Limnohabitans sp. 2KL-17 TaxID=1100704 RepID=UPI000D3D7024|nr:DUF3047 domain-containing protein [Limnohabitans sp. 2KL-17]PUE62498.1 hypothetical protein B9Z45_04005 [Limnohabitans sp. 2KL-17]
MSRRRVDIPAACVCRPALLTLGVAAWALSVAVHAQTLTPLVPAEGLASSSWRFVGFPKAKADIPVTRFELAEVQAERALKVSTQSSYGTLVHEHAPMAAGRLEWRWRLDQALIGSKLAPDILTKAGDDAALKVCVMFDHPLQRLPFVERSLLRIARRVSGEDLPAATLCYVWDSVYPAGLQSANPYTKRVRFITLQGKGAPLGQWQNESRDVAADFAQLFADESPAGSSAPQARAVLIGADSDNTGSRSVGWVKALDWVR